MDREARVFMSAAEVGAELGVSPAAIYRAMWRGRLPTVRVSRNLCVPREALATWRSAFRSRDETTERKETG